MVKKDAHVKSQYGIHARPSMAIAVAATNDFPRTKITIYCPSTKQTGNAKSILELLEMSLPCGAKVTVSASGENEEIAASAIVLIIESFEVEVK